MIVCGVLVGPDDRLPNLLTPIIGSVQCHLHVDYI